MRRVLRVVRGAWREGFGKVEVRRRDCIACVRLLGLCHAMAGGIGGGFGAGTRISGPGWRPLTVSECHVFCWVM